MATEITTTDIVDAALGPSQVSVDNRTVTARSIDELTAALKLKAALEASASGAGGWGMVKVARAVPPGTI